MKVVQVVKRFGLCGGMEEYVYRLTESLDELGINVSVLCEEKYKSKISSIEVFELGKCFSKPRWLSHLIFAQKVKSWVMNSADKRAIIHSHERINCHHVSTLHSSLYNFPKKFSFPTLRGFMNERIESMELKSKSVQAIVPVSKVIIGELEHKYPELNYHIKEPVTPGVFPLNIRKKKYNPKMPVIGFMGNEWKRKGLPMAIEIWRGLRSIYPDIQICLAGFSVNEKIGLRKEEKSHIEILGYIRNKSSFFEKIDLLIHPAKEAYSMVIAEALSVSIPVFCSLECGAANDNPIKDLLLSCKSPVALWVERISEVLRNQSLMNKEGKTINDWNSKALEYIEVYKQIKIK